jgi:hypothetical protein
MRVSTSPPINSGVANQHEYVTLIDDNLTLATCFACPAELLRKVISINALRLEARPLEWQETHTETAIGLLQHILDFDPIAWAEDAIQSGKRTPEDRCIWLKIGQVYHDAVTLYCIGSLAHVFQCANTYRLYVSSCRKTVRHSLHYHIVDLFSPRYNQLVKLSLWPLIVAGIEVTADYPDFQTSIRQYLEQVACKIGTASPYEAINYLERFWQHETQYNLFCRWETFESAMVFVL